MDSGSTPDLLTDPLGAAELLQETGGVEFRHIQDAASHTAEQLASKRAALDDPSLPDSLSIVVFGSWARDELTPGSDDDWAVLVNRRFADYEPDVVRAMALAQAQLGNDGREPGSEAVFGVPFDIVSLTKNIGLDADTNRNFTRRMLLLLESRELAGTAHAPCRQQVLDRYLAFGARNHRPPRFLLNDIVRYWRTICVDFEGKNTHGNTSDRKWVTRNAKLRTSRKLLFAGGLLPVLLCHLQPAPAMSSFLTAWLSAPPKDRLAAAFLHYGAIEEGVRTFAAYDRWIAIMADEQARADLKSLTADTRDNSPLWNDIRAIGEELQRGLLALLFETDLRPLAPQYSIF